MEKIVRDLGLKIGKSALPGMLDVSGDSDKLKELRKILDDEGYNDDTDMVYSLAEMTGMNLMPADSSTTISRIMIVSGFGNGYLALA